MTRIADHKAQLEARLAELQDRLSAIDDALDIPAERDGEENATEREGDEVLEDLGQSGLHEIREITAALARIEAGSYGIYAKCGD